MYKNSTQNFHVEIPWTITCIEWAAQTSSKNNFPISWNIPRSSQVHVDTLASKIIILCEEYMNKMKCRNHPLNILLPAQSGKCCKQNSTQNFHVEIPWTISSIKWDAQIFENNFPISWNIPRSSQACMFMLIP
jgi:hypothetical protein